jgi:hypothetical protein
VSTVTNVLERLKEEPCASPRLMSLVEAVANVFVGLIVALAAQIVVFPPFGLQATLGQNVLLARVFTSDSIVRSYALPRMFEAIRE